MERKIERLGEDKDALIQRANKLLAQKGFWSLFGANHFKPHYLREMIMSLKQLHDFTGRDKIVLHFNTHNMDERRQYSEHIATHKFPTMSVAHFFIEKVLAQAQERVPHPSRKWKSANRLLVNDWIIITSDAASLEDIMEAKIDKNYKLPHPYGDYADSIANFRWGSHPQVNQQKNAHEYAPRRAEERASEHNVHKRQTAPEPRKRPVEPPKASKRPSNGDTVSIGDICAILSIEPKEARLALRKAKYPKPQGGWQWAKSEKEKISRDVKSAVEKARKKS